MGRKIINLLVMILLVVLSKYTDFIFPQVNLEHVLYTFISLSGCYFLFGIILNGIVVTQIDDDKLKYSFRKTIDILFFVVFLIIVLRIWIVDPQALLVSYGIVAAGLAVALQDVFKNFAGGLVVILSKLYKVEDRIEINNKVGDVIDIGILYTTIFEIREWVSGDQPTGRLTKIPNGVVLSSNVNNFNQDHDFIWDELELVLTYGSNWQKALKKILLITEKKIGLFEEAAQKDIKKLKQRYYIAKKELKPKVYLSLTDNWISLSVRYLTEVKQRREIKNELYFDILKMIDRTKDIDIASTTSIINIASFPELTVKKYAKKK